MQPNKTFLISFYLVLCNIQGRSHQTTGNNKHGKTEFDLSGKKSPSSSIFIFKSWHVHKTRHLSNNATSIQRHLSACLKNKWTSWCGFFVCCCGTERTGTKGQNEKLKDVCRNACFTLHCIAATEASQSNVVLDHGFLKEKKHLWYTQSSVLCIIHLIIITMIKSSNHSLLFHIPTLSIWILTVTRLHSLFAGTQGRKNWQKCNACRVNAMWHRKIGFFIQPMILYNFKKSHSSNSKYHHLPFKFNVELMIKICGIRQLTLTTKDW